MSGSNWVRCPECGTRMRRKGDQYYCKECDEYYDESELLDCDVYIDRSSSTPAVCQACGGVYPACSIGCDILDDD